MKIVLTALTALSVALVSAGTSQAVIVATGEGRQLGAPTGSLANAGWQYIGQIGAFTGIPIGPNHFVTAKHTGQGITGHVLNYQSVAYTVTGFSDIPNSDLRVSTVGGTFPSYAPLWNTSVDGTEVGRPMFVAGRGIARGRAIYGPVGSASPVMPTSNNISLLTDGDGERRAGGGPTPDPSYEFKGWEWGVNDNQQSWGNNIVEGAFSDPNLGQLIGFDFDLIDGAMEFEAAMAGGDSGGGVFVQNNAGVWKLAGVNLAVDGPFSRTPGGPYGFASLVDMGGYYIGTVANHVLVPDLAEPIPGFSYSTRISSYRGPITTITGVSL
ncbi:MAG TPA: hypothetical protein PK402_06880, partial [Tepidisphaeraceae bacterium]|nr:hypothetical protein [Tepidisphaeraceae bacterium]